MRFTRVDAGVFDLVTPPACNDVVCASGDESLAALEVFCGPVRS